MSILIIALPRTGSTELGKRLALKYNLKYEFEPFNTKSYTYDKNLFKKCVLKTIIFHHPTNVNGEHRIEWLLNLTKEFDEVILLSRKNLTDCAESWAYLMYKEKEKSFKSNQPYLWERTPNYDKEYEYIQKCNDELIYISNILNIPITFYEDIYDSSEPGKLRKGNRTDFESKII
jgi:hypothetical protein